MKTINIAIDGPSGAGKSTIAKLLSEQLGFVYLDTGAMYRACAYFALQKGVDVANEGEVLGILDEMRMDIVYENGAQKVLVQGEDVTPYIREPHISMGASTISKIPNVRLKLVELQRRIASETSCVLDGRDIGTFVLPHADYKFFLTASANERAKRRHLELIQTGQNVTLEDVLAEMIKRDEQDSKRAFAPLKAAEDAIVVDTTLLSIKEVITLLASKVRLG